MKITKITVYALCVMVLVLMALSYADTDLYYILANGQYIIKNGIPETNPFIQTQGVPIVIQNYAWCAIVAFFYNILGNFGLTLLNGLVIAGCTAVGVLLLNETDILKKVPLYAKIFCMFFAIRCSSYISLRPEILTVLLILIQCLALERYRKTGNLWHLTAIPAVMFAEANLHSSYIAMHLFFGACYLIPGIKIPWLYIKDRSIKGKNRIIAGISLIVGFLASFINPYGYKGVFYVFGALKDGYLSKWNIMEQRPLNAKVSGVFPVIMILLIIICYIIIKKRADSLTVYTSVPLIMLTFMTLKWIPFVPIAIIYLVSSAANEEGAVSVYNSVIGNNKLKKALYVLSGVLLLFVITANAVRISHIAKNTENSLSEFHEECFLYIEENNPDGSVFCSQFANANFYEFKGITVFLDARPELYKGDIAEKYLTVLQMKNPFDDDSPYLSLDEYTAVIESTESDYFVVNKSSAHICHGLDNSKMYAEVASISDDDYVLYEKLR